MAKPDEKLTKTAILKRIYRVLELEYIGGGTTVSPLRTSSRRLEMGVVVMLSKEPVAGRPHLGPPVVTHSGESGCGKGLRQTESVEIYAEEYRLYAGGI